MTNKNKSVPANIGLFVTAIIWGFAFVVVKDSLNAIPPLYMLAFRFTIASVALSLLFIKKLKSIRLKLIKNGAVLGFFLFISYALQTVGCKYTTAGKNAFLTTIYVVIVPFLHWMINKKKPDIYCYIAAILAVIGIGLLSLDGNLSMNIGDILTLLCGLGYALHIIFIDRYTEYQDPIILTVLQLTFAALFSWLCALIFEGGLPESTFAPDSIYAMLYLGLMSTMLAFLLQNVCQKYTHPSTASLILSTEAVFGALFSVLLLENEEMTAKMIAGCMLLFIAITISETKLNPFQWLKLK